MVRRNKGEYVFLVPSDWFILIKVLPTHSSMVLSSGHFGIHLGGQILHPTVCASSYSV